jgi:hypothetical protein
MIKINLLKNHPYAIPALATIWHEVLGKIWMPEIGIEEIESLYYEELQHDTPLPGSKMKCNALECLLKIQAQKGVANEKVPSINSMGKNKDSDVKAIGVLINEDCRSA